ncbi:MAG: hypothetical protein P8Y70_10810 [Candidatus Lokiarchaeota archaeon]
MRVAIDVDGVLLDLMVEYCEIFNKKYNTSYSKEDVAHWEFFRDWNISEEAAYEIFHKIYENSQKVPFIDNDALKVLNSLYQNHYIDIVSARTFKFKRELRKALESHKVYRNVHYRNLILVSNKPYDIKLNLDYDIYVDDNPNLVNPITQFSKKFLLLYDQPWNQNAKNSKNVIRIKNWKEIETTFKQLENGLF